MKAIDTEVISINGEGVRTVRALIIGTTMPNPLPTTGDGIEGLNPTDVFSAGSIIFCPDDWTKAVANADGVFKKE
jgi:hypothetical protein